MKHEGYYLKNIFRDWCSLLSIEEIMNNKELIALIREIEIQLITGKEI